MTMPSTGSTLVKILFVWIGTLFAVAVIHELLGRLFEIPLTPGLLVSLLVLYFLVKYTIDEMQHLGNAQRNARNPPRQR